MGGLCKTVGKETVFFLKFLVLDQLFHVTCWIFKTQGVNIYVLNIILVLITRDFQHTKVTLLSIAVLNKTPKYQTLNRILKCHITEFENPLSNMDNYGTR